MICQITKQNVSLCITPKANNSQTSSSSKYLFFALGTICLIGSLLAICCLYPQIGHRSLVFGIVLALGLELLSFGYYHNYKTLSLQKNDVPQSLPREDEHPLQSEDMEHPVTPATPPTISSNTLETDDSVRQTPPETILNFSPDKSILDYQLNPPDKVTQSIQSALHKYLTVALAKSAYQDLNRLDLLVFNGETILDSKAHQQVEGGLSTYVFHKLEEKFSSTSLAVHTANLLGQNLEGEVLKQVAKKKGLISENELHSTHAVGKKKAANILTTDAKNFKLVNEMLIQKTYLEDIKQIAFFKIKTVVQGSLKSLESKKSAEMALEVTYTEDHPSMQKACEDHYSLSDRETYLKI